MKFINLLFYIVLFLGFCLPTNTTFYFPIGGALISIREFALLLLPLINFFCTSENKVKTKDHRIKNLIILFFVSVIISEVLKVICYNQNIIDIFRSLRNGLPLFASLLLILQGINSDIKIVWKVFLLAVATSVILSILTLFIYIPINYNLTYGTNLLILNSGRLFNDNASFGFIALYLLLQDDNPWYTSKRLFKLIFILSIISFVLAYNRTYLFLLFLLFSYMFFFKMQKHRFKKTIILSGIILFTFFAPYFFSTPIHQQIERRFFSLINGKSSIAKQTVHNNRDFMYQGFINRVKEGYWIIGIPYKVKLFNRYDKQQDRVIPMTKMDISLANILIRCGIFSLILFIGIYIRLLKKKHLPLILGLLFLLGSLNVDALYNQNSIFFIIIICFIMSYHKEKQEQGHLKKGSFLSPKKDKPH